jgi:squalene-hopene/tetraprenyl-beta-curcumene cyclase
MCRSSRVLIAGLILIGSSAAHGEDAPKKIGPNSADEPLAERFSLERGARFLDEVSVDWTRERKCGTCHTNYAYMMARPAVKGTKSSEMSEIRSFFEGRVAGWDKPEKSAKPRWDAEVVATAAALSFNDAATTGKLHPLTRAALDRTWTLQRDNGSWEWLKCDWPPLEHDNYYGAALVAVAVGHAPDNYKDSEAARRGLERLRRYFRATPAPDLHHKALLLWASTAVDGLMETAEREQTVKELLALQRSDGGWSLPSLGHWSRHDGTPNAKDAPSDGYGTGYVVYVLRQAGVAADADPIRRGVSWLRTHQRASGRWFTRSLSTDKFHYITHAGTGFALLALSSCEPD